MAHKTNAVRLLDQFAISYELREYEVDPEDLAAETVATKIGLPPEQVFKTLVARGDRNGICMAVIPGDAFRVTVTVGQVQGWLAPHRAVLNDTQGDYVFQVSGARAVRVPVTVVSTSGDTDVLQGALDASRPLVVDGAFQLQPGALVRAAGRS